MKRLNGQVALVTGASSGIGAEVVRALLREGALVELLDRAEPPPELASSQGATFSKLDVTDAKRTNAVITDIHDRHGRIDIVVNAAGIGAGTPFLEMTPDEFDRVIAVNLRGVFLVSRYAAPYMVEAGRGRIINFASQLAIKGDVGIAHYVASKAGVIGLTKAMAHELAPHGVLVNAVAPGPVDTPMMAAATEAFREDKMRGLPRGRFGTPAEIAPTVLLLATSPDGDNYVGQTLGPNGGDVMP